MELFSNIRSIVLDAIAFARNLCPSCPKIQTNSRPRAPGRFGLEAPRTGVLMTEDSSSHWPIKRRYVYSETSRRAGLEFVCIFRYDGCRLPLVEERLRIRRPTKNGLDAPAVLCIDLSRRSSNILLRAVACWSTEVRQVLDDRLRRRTFLLPIPPRTQLRPYHMVDSSALGPCIDFENAR